MAEKLSSSAQKVQDALAAHGLGLAVVELPASTRTAVEAARAVGCQVGQIVKSLVFKREHSGSAVLVIASGSNRVNVEKLSLHIGEPLVMADADFVRQQTGFAIGGVPPTGHPAQLETYVDRDLLAYEELWAAAGTPNAVFRLSPEDLLKITAGEVVAIC